MNYIYRRSIKLTLSLFLLSSLAFSEGRSVLDSIASRISNSNWMVFKCEVVQNLGDDIWNDQITISSFGPKRFEVLASDQVVRIVNDTVWTCLKGTKQVTIDRYFSEAPSVFHFLTGNLDDLDLIKTDSKNNLESITFYDRITGYKGQLLVDPTTYLPKSLEIELDVSSVIEISILEIITGGTDQPEFFQWDESWSILDLRE